MAESQNYGFFRFHKHSPCLFGNSEKVGPIAFSYFYGIFLHDSRSCVYSFVYFHDLFIFEIILLYGIPSAQCEVKRLHSIFTGISIRLTGRSCISRQAYFLMALNLGLNAGNLEIFLKLCLSFVL